MAKPFLILVDTPLINLLMCEPELQSVGIFAETTLFGKVDGLSTPVASGLRVGPSPPVRAADLALELANSCFQSRSSSVG